LFLVLLLCSTAAFAAVKTQVDRFHLGELETLTLSIEISGDDSGEPETAVLEKDFEVLSSNHSSSYSLINGAMSTKSTWIIHLRPRRSGALTIPAMQVGAATTQPITVQVSKAAAGNDPDQGPKGDIWIDMHVEPEQVLVQQQAIVSIRIYQAAALHQAQLTEPSAASVIMERLGEDVSYQATRNGRNWQVLERRYALFPQQSGTINIEPVQLDGSMIVRNSGFSSPFAQSARPVRVRSGALTLDVSSIPADWDGDEWLPAGKLELIEDWPAASTFKAGEPVTRTLTVRAEGLASSQLPSVSGMLPDHLKAYPDQPQLTDNKAFDGVTGSRQEKVAIMPMQPGTYILPQIDVPWWNTKTGRRELATIPPRTFKVVAAAGAIAPVPNRMQPGVTEPAVITVSAKPVPAQSELWQWIAFISSAGWLLTLVWLWVSHRRHGAGEADGNSTRASNRKRVKKSVELACRHNDARACEQALLGFAHLQWPVSPVNNLAVMACRCEAELAGEITALEKHLYASGKQDWSGAVLLQAFQKADFGTPEACPAKQPVALPDLYPD